MGGTAAILRLTKRSLSHCVFLFLLAIRPLAVPLLRLEGGLILLALPVVFGGLYLAAKSATSLDNAPSPYWVGGGSFGLALAAFIVADGYDSLVLALCPEDRVIMLR